ncbi:MAG: hypothetical protein ACRDTE_08455 [Pseudonocardiaceae bacterium]
MSDRLEITFQLASFLVAVGALVVAVATAPHSVQRAKGWALNFLARAAGKVRQCATRTWRGHRRALAVVGGVVLLLGVAAPVVLLRDEDPPPNSIDYSRPVLIETAESGLRLTVDANHDPLEAEALVISPRQSSVDAWDLVSPSPHNADFRQMRAHGKLLMCLEVEDCR